MVTRAPCTLHGYFFVPPSPSFNHPLALRRSSCPSFLSFIATSRTIPRILLLLLLLLLLSNTRGDSCNIVILSWRVEVYEPDEVMKDVEWIETNWLNTRDLEARHGVLKDILRFYDIISLLVWFHLFKYRIISVRINKILEIPILWSCFSQFHDSSILNIGQLIIVAFLLHW